MNLLTDSALISLINQIYGKNAKNIMIKIPKSEIVFEFNIKPFLLLKPCNFFNPKYQKSIL